MAKRFRTAQDALPLKLRYKTVPVTEFIAANMSRVQLIFEHNGDYLALGPQDRSALLRHTVGHTGCMGGILVAHQSQLLDDPCFRQSNDLIFGSTVMSSISLMNEFCDSDLTFVKLILSITAFSTTNYALYLNGPPVTFVDVKTIVRIQDSYTELVWRYLVYKYSFEGAVIRFCQLLRYLFHTNFTVVEASRAAEYSNLIDTVVEQTEQVLCLNN